jgi:hypothetical protein
MSRTRHIWHNGEWVDVTGWKRPAPVFPSIHRDTMDALVHPATGETFDSKSAFRAVTKARGLVELGNDAPTTAAPPVDVGGIKEDIAEAITMLEQGYRPDPTASAVMDGVETRVYEVTT